jgi:hypothetical protein
MTETLFICSGHLAAAKNDNVTRGKFSVLFVANVGNQ